MQFGRSDVAPSRASQRVATGRSPVHDGGGPTRVVQHEERSGPAGHVGSGEKPPDFANVTQVGGGRFLSFFFQRSVSTVRVPYVRRVLNGFETIVS